MKLEKLLSALWAFLFSFALSAASTMCMVTAFDFAIDTGLLLRTCLWASLICTVCYSLPLGLLPIGCGAFCLWEMWRKGIPELSLEALLNRLSRQYDRAYGWGIIRWGYRVAEEMEPDMVYMLCILGAVIALLCAWSVCRRKTIIPALVLSFLTFGTCFVVNDTVPATPWLYLLILCFVLLIMTSTVRRQEATQGNRLCLLLTPVTALALLLLFLAVPQKGYTGQTVAKNFADSILQSDSMQILLGHVDDGNGVSSGGNIDSVDLRSVGYRLDSKAQVLQVTAPYTGTLYLRGRSMDYFDGISWQQSDNSYENLYWPGQQLQNVGELTISTRFAHRMLYVPYYASITDQQDLAAGVLNENSLTEYSFTCRKSISPIDTPYQSATFPTVQSPDAYIQMDPTVQKWAESLVKKLVADELAAYPNALTIASYVRNSASYNTRTSRMPATQKNFAQWFLEESETGYCVHFATAATVLLQAAGIPARYVTGYYAQVVEGETVTVYSNQAHAWAEYWVPGFGWAVLEATPPDFAVEPEETTEATVTGTTPSVPQATLPDTTRPQVTDTPTQEPQANHDWILWVLLGIVAVCTLATIAELQRRIRRHLRKRKLEQASTNEKALLYWQTTVLYARLLNEEPDKELYLLAERAKFSQHTLTDDQLQQFETYVLAASAKLRHHNPLRRFYYRIVLAIC